MNSFSITRTGTYLTVQDFGRFHYQHLGISPSGAMDPRILQELEKVIPQHGSQFLEFAYVGPSLKVSAGAIRVCVGGHCNIFVQKNNNTQIEHQPYTSINLFEGDELTIHNTIDSVYGYIAIENGLGLEPCLDSFSTDTKANIGSINRPLRIGDSFNIQEDVSSWQVAFNEEVNIEKQNNFKVYPGPQLNYFSDLALQSFVSSTYTITTQSDRMGLRLQGAPLISHISHDILSEGILPGCIQVPSNGQPIVLMRDIPCTGGYPKIAILASEDIAKIAQLPPGSHINFDL
jgi:antagonist of KipI